MKNLFAFLAIAILMAVSSQTLQAQEEEYGMSSFYHDDFQGRETAYGDTYDKNKLTAAHKKHPYGTMLRVTRLDNQRSVDVKVTDKGPFIKGRVVDLSRAAAERLGLVRDGTAEVRVDVISYPGGRQPVASTTRTRTAAETTSRPESYEETPQLLPSAREEKEGEEPKVVEAKKEEPKAKEERSKEVKPQSASVASSRASLVGKDYAQYDLYQIELRRPAKSGYGVQIANLTTYENVLKEVADLQAKWFDNILVSVEPREDSKTTYRLILGPFSSEAAAENYEKNLKKKYKINGFTIKLEDLSYKK